MPRTRTEVMPPGIRQGRQQSASRTPATGNRDLIVEVQLELLIAASELTTLRLELWGRFARQDLLIVGTEYQGGVEQREGGFAQPTISTEVTQELEPEFVWVVIDSMNALVYRCVIDEGPPVGSEG
jgi:hypothetical protein